MRKLQTSQSTNTATKKFDLPVVHDTDAASNFSISS